MSTADRSPAAQLATPAQFLKGVGPQRAELLERLGLATVRDVLFFFPRDYQDFTDLRDVPQLEPNKLQTVRGVVQDIDLRPRGIGRSMLGVLVQSANGFLRAVWFNQPFLRDKFSIGQHLLVSGKPRFRGLCWEMSHPLVETLADDEPSATGRILPVYPATEGLHQWQIRQAVRAALEGYAGLLEEAFPPSYLEAHRLWPIAQALAAIHFPTDHEALAQARRRFIYQELFILQLGLAIRRQQYRTQARAPQLPITPTIDTRIRRLFPFDLTAGQRAAIAEITADMTGPVPMNRLLQGDVGSGKTVVAVYAMLLAVAHRHQAVLMAPTEVLARQHAATLERLLAASQVRRAQLLGGMPAKTRSDMIERIGRGEIDLIVGTQAILQEDVRFSRLGLVVIDEQHKFGVRQRAVLKQAGTDPHYLVMTATPIPRTVTMTLFGDLDVSVLRESPPGRQKVYTYQASEDRRAKWWEFFRNKLRQGRQGYVVVPLVEESEQIASANLAETYEALANGELEEFRLGLVHGRMSSAEKDLVMDDFRAGRIQVLVCTSVVEVGVDVPNATVMTIETAERFGLAQLHQLRGRISRGSHPGFCCAFSSADSEEAITRLKAFTATRDGFDLAEIDFRLRGPGEIFGIRQHGLPPLRIADLQRDAAELEEARTDARALVASDANLTAPEHARLHRMVWTRYGQVLELADVG
jgi:ATP-dependent DNA helicase RecG